MRARVAVLVVTAPARRTGRFVADGMVFVGSGDKLLAYKLPGS